MALPIIAKSLEGAGKIKETGQNLLKDKEIPNTEKVKTTLLQQAIETNKDKIEAVRNAIENQEKNNESEEEGNDNSEKKGLSEEEKAKIKEETGWSDEIIDAIGSWEEYEIYKKAGLVEAEIGGRKALIRGDIDWDQKDEDGRTNKERVEQGLSPINKDGKTIELHHIGQHKDSPLAELTQEEHRGKGNDTILHDKTKPTETHGEGNTWREEKNQYWNDRVNAEENK